MRSIAGAIMVLGACICFAAGVLANALARVKGEEFFVMELSATLIFGIMGVVIVFAGFLDKKQQQGRPTDGL